MFILLIFSILLTSCSLLFPPEKVKKYHIYELTFTSSQNYDRNPDGAMDLELKGIWSNGSIRYTVYGFWDGGNKFKMRFCPTETGIWTLSDVSSGFFSQHDNHKINCIPSSHHGFWIPKDIWFRRSDGTAQYFIGNTHYEFLKRRNSSQIEADFNNQKDYFKKIRMSVIAGNSIKDSETNQKWLDGLKPFLTANGEQSCAEDHNDHYLIDASRPNPEWFQKRADVAVKAAFNNDQITDLILGGPDNMRCAIVEKKYLKYIAARYGAYPNVWICLGNEMNEVPCGTKEKGSGPYDDYAKTFRNYSPYPNPITVHIANQVNNDVWQQGTGWMTHAIGWATAVDPFYAAEIINQSRLNGGGVPAINDEIGYEPSIDSSDIRGTAVGTWMGGGYSTTGQKIIKAHGQYYQGNFNSQEHTNADNFGFMADYITNNIDFSELSPDGVGSSAKLVNKDKEYIFWGNKETLSLGKGTYMVTYIDVDKMETKVASKNATGDFNVSGGNNHGFYHAKRQNASRKK